MDYKKVIKDYLKTSGGLITTRYCEENNIPRVYLSRLVKEDFLENVSRGLYRTKDSDFDELYFFQHRYKKAIYSYETALYLMSITDKFVVGMDVSVPSNYKFNELDDLVNIHYVKSDLWNLGIKEVKTMFGNIVKIYGYERCLCDFIKDKDNMDKEVYVNLIRSYRNIKDKDVNLLYEIASKMGILTNVREILEIVYE